jgi:uncharacterized protein (TIGR03437 family)
VVNASGGILNGASFQPTIAPNTWITVFGRLLSGTSRPWASEDFSGAKLPTSVEDVSVSINGRPAYVCFVSPNQVNVLTPADIAEGSATVVLSRGDLKSSPVPVQVQRVAPALFQFEPENRRYSIAVHADGSLVGKATLFPGATTPARPGEIIILWGTGFGPTIPDIPKGEAVTAALPLAATPVVTVGGSAAEVLYAGLSGTGLYQINIRVPPGAPDGDLALSIQLENGRTQEGAVLTVQK